MSYEKQNFVDGQVLMAAQLNLIEDGLASLESSVERINALIDAKLEGIEILSDAEGVGF